MDRPGQPYGRREQPQAYPYPPPSKPLPAVGMAGSSASSSVQQPPVREFERAAYSGPAGHPAHARRPSLINSRRPDDDNAHLPPTPRRPSAASPGMTGTASFPSASAGDSYDDRRYRPRQQLSAHSPRWRSGEWTDDREPPRKRLHLANPTHQPLPHGSPYQPSPYLPLARGFERQQMDYDEDGRKPFDSEEEGEMESDRSEGGLGRQAHLHEYERSQYAGPERSPYGSGDRFQRNGRMSLLPQHAHRPQPRPQHHARPFGASSNAQFTPLSPDQRSHGQFFRPPAPDSGWAHRAQAPLRPSPPPAPRPPRPASPPLRPLQQSPPRHPKEHVRSPPPPQPGTPLSASYSPASNVSGTGEGASPLDQGGRLNGLLAETPTSQQPEDYAGESAATPASPSPVKGETDASADISLGSATSALDVEERARRMGLLAAPWPSEQPEPALSAAAKAELDDRMDVDESHLTPADSTAAKAAELTSSGRSEGPPTPIDEPVRDFAACLDDKLRLDMGHHEDMLLRLAADFRKYRPDANVIRPRVPIPPTETMLANDVLLQPFLCDLFRKRDEKLSVKAGALKSAYRELQTAWSEHCDELDRVRERLKRKPAVTPATPAFDPASGTPYGPTGPGVEPLATPASVGAGAGATSSGRSTRRTGMNSFGGLGDAVRSEAEFQEILATLEHADLRDPNVRAMRTTATVPDMALSSQDRALLVIDESNARVKDPLDFYGLADQGPAWSEEEEDVFRRRYAQYPKQFGKIAAKLPDKSRADCVRYYYLTKHLFDYRSLLDRRGRDAMTGVRRKKAKKFAGRSAAPMGKSLLGKPLLGGVGDDDDEDEADADDDDPDSFPPSPPPGLATLPPAPAMLSVQGGDPSRASSKVVFSTARQSAIPANGTELTVNGEFPSVLRQPGDTAAYLATIPTLGAGEAGMLPSAAGEKPKAKRRGKNAAMDVDAGEDGQAPKRRSATSSYWTIEERAQFLDGLKQHGKDWDAIAAGVSNKTAMQCRNYFQNNSKKLGLQELVDGRPGANGSTNSSHQDYMVPIDVPLQQSIADARRNVPTPLSPPTLPSPHSGVWRAPPTGTFSASSAAAPSFEPSQPNTAPRQSSMNIRNLLNDDAASPSPALMDAKTWFGGDDGDDDASTEDERETRPAPTAQPAPRQQHDLGPTVPSAPALPPVPWASAPPRDASQSQSWRPQTMPSPTPTDASLPRRTVLPSFSQGFPITLPAIASRTPSTGSPGLLQRPAQGLASPRPLPITLSHGDAAHLRSPPSSVLPRRVASDSMAPMLPLPERPVVHRAHSAVTSPPSATHQPGPSLPSPYRPPLRPPPADAP